jgi:TorA-specific chaperone
MQERLASAGLSVAGEGNQPPDHLAVELEYLYFLLSKAREAAARELETRAAEFAKTELCSWLPLFSDRLGRIPDSAPYNDAAVLAVYLSRLIAGE